LLTAVPFLRRTTWRLPDTYHSAGHGQGTATLKFYEGRDILTPRAGSPSGKGRTCSPAYSLTSCTPSRPGEAKQVPPQSGLCWSANWWHAGTAPQVSLRVVPVTGSVFEFLFLTWVELRGLEPWPLACHSWRNRP